MSCFEKSKVWELQTLTIIKAIVLYMVIYYVLSTCL